MRKVMRAPATATPSTPLQTYLREIDQRKKAEEQAAAAGIPPPAIHLERLPGQFLADGALDARGSLSRGMCQVLLYQIILKVCTVPEEWYATKGRSTRSAID